MYTSRFRYTRGASVLAALVFAGFLISMAGLMSGGIPTERVAVEQGSQGAQAVVAAPVRVATPAGAADKCTAGHDYEIILDKAKGPQIKEYNGCTTPSIRGADEANNTKVQILAGNKDSYTYWGLPILNTNSDWSWLCNGAPRPTATIAPTCYIKVCMNHPANARGQIRSCSYTTAKEGDPIKSAAGGHIKSMGAYMTDQGLMEAKDFDKALRDQLPATALPQSQQYPLNDQLDAAQEKYDECMAKNVQDASACTADEKSVAIADAAVRIDDLTEQSNRRCSVIVKPANQSICSQIEAELKRTQAEKDQHEKDLAALAASRSVLAPPAPPAVDPGVQAADDAYYECFNFYGDANKCADQHRELVKQKSEALQACQENGGLSCKDLEASLKREQTSFCALASSKNLPECTSAPTTRTPPAVPPTPAQCAQNPQAPGCAQQRPPNTFPPGGGLPTGGGTQCTPAEQQACARNPNSGVCQKCAMGSGLPGQGGGGRPSGGQQRPSGGGQQTQPQQPQQCQQAYYCQDNAVYNRNQQCQTQISQQCPQGYTCSGNSCIQSPYGVGTDGQACTQPPAQPAASSCTVGTWQPTRAPNTCQTGWECKSGTTSTNGTAQLSCQPMTVEQGMPVSISWSCTGAASSAGTGFSTGGLLASSTTITAATIGLGKSVDTTYGLSCTDAQSQVVTTQCVVKTVNPWITFVSVPKDVQSGGKSTLGWITGGMQGCTVSSRDYAGFTAEHAGPDKKKPNGSVSTPELTRTSTFWLTCTTIGGSTKEASTTIGVIAQ